MKIGFIGTGNMGSGIIKGIINSKFILKENINVFDVDKEKVDCLTKKYGITYLNSELKIVENSNIVILAIKPSIYKSVLEKIMTYCLHRS